MQKSVKLSPVTIAVNDVNGLEAAFQNASSWTTFSASAASSQGIAVWGFKADATFVTYVFFVQRTHGQGIGKRNVDGTWEFWKFA